MAIARCNWVRRASGILLTLTLCLAGQAQPAAAQSFFEALFGGAFRRPEPLPPQTASFADPLSTPSRERPRATRDASGFGRGTVFCVRTCDGRYFPMQRHAGQSPAALCHSFCPASQTVVFSGGKIDDAVAADGTHYADLDTAFVYRDKVVSGCTCNGAEGGGLARLDTTSDPTLRPGDIIATDKGFATFRGRTKSDAAEFSPIDPSSSAWARKLAETKIRPAPPTHEITPVAEDTSRRTHDGRRQAAR